MSVEAKRDALTEQKIAGKSPEIIETRRNKRASFAITYRALADMALLAGNTEARREYQGMAEMFDRT